MPYRYNLPFKLNTVVSWFKRAVVEWFRFPILTDRLALDNRTPELLIQERYIYDLMEISKSSSSTSHPGFSSNKKLKQTT